MSLTTSITDLPVNPAGTSNSENNIHLNVEETSQNPSQNQNSIQLDQSTINQIISGLQQASSTGITNLPSRDIPRDTTNLTQDPHTQPNFIPQPTVSNTDYIDEYETNEDIMRQYNRNERREDVMDSLYSEIQIPLLLIMLYFIFQLPIFKNTLFKYIPSLFNGDGNINIYGIFFTSGIFGASYYSLSKVIL